jgi:hypothetical protein
MAEWPSPEPSDGTYAKRLGLAARPVEEFFPSIALISQKNTPTCRLGQSAGGDLISSVSGQEHCSDYDLGRPVDERMDLESVKSVA